MNATCWRALLFVAAVWGAACGGGGGLPAPAATPSGLRFLMAGEDGLTEVVIGAGSRPIIRRVDQSFVLDPAISPDGKRIAFALQVPAKQTREGGLDFGSDIYVASASGKDQRRLAAHRLTAEFLRTPAWLSDTELLYTYRGRDATGAADFHVDRLDLRTGVASRFLDWGVDAVASRDGRHIAYVAVDPRTQEETLTLSTADLKASRELVTSASNLGLFSALAFSPDGTRVAFAAVDLAAPIRGGASLLPAASRVFAAHPYAQDVWIVNADGSGLRRLADIAENMPSLTWSGDGTIVYAQGPGALWKLDAAGSRAEQIGPGVALGQIRVAFWAVDARASRRPFDFRPWFPNHSAYSRRLRRHLSRLELMDEGRDWLGPIPTQGPQSGL